MDPDQARQNVGPDLDPKCLALMYLKKLILKKQSADDKNMQNELISYVLTLKAMLAAYKISISVAS